MNENQKIMSRIQVAELIGAELDHAYSKHGREQWSRHEFYAILKEEVDELWDDIKADKPTKDVLHEAIQVAAMVFRFLETGDKYGDRYKLPPCPVPPGMTQ